jgi:hypothetical protein
MTTEIEEKPKGAITLEEMLAVLNKRCGVKPGDVTTQVPLQIGAMLGGAALQSAFGPNTLTGNEEPKPTGEGTTSDIVDAES